MFSQRRQQEGVASPHAGLATHGQVAAKAPCKGAAGCGQPTREAGATAGAAAHRSGACRPWAHPVAVRRPQRGPATGRPQGAATRGQPCRQQGRRRQPQGWPPLGRVAAGKQGQRRRRRRWGKSG
ncbi:hypothetical protein GW17_00024601 [Ensete ventricosum]|nr:hypothetical protein GW17_00024601 [Ensete ventricosum]